jgi:hypothetical protein
MGVDRPPQSHGGWLAATPNQVGGGLRATPSHGGWPRATPKWGWLATTPNHFGGGLRATPSHGGGLRATLHGFRGGRSTPMWWIGHPRPFFSYFLWCFGVADPPHGVDRPPQIFFFFNLKKKRLNFIIFY